MKPIVLTILGGLSILLIISHSTTTATTNNSKKQVLPKATKVVRTVLQPVQKFTLHDFLFSRYGL